MKTLQCILCAASVLALMSVGANAATYIIDATTPIVSWLDTGIDASPGATYLFAVNDPSNLWSAGNNDPYSRESTANGIPPSVGYGTYTYEGAVFNFGALVGDAGGTFFLIGTGPTVKTGLSGELTVGYWDSNYPDNSGTQSLTVSSVPEPATWAMLLAGFAGLGVLGFRRRTGARILA